MIFIKLLFPHPRSQTASYNSKILKISISKFSPTGGKICYLNYGVAAALAESADIEG